MTKQLHVYATRLTLGDGGTLEWTWQAEDAMHALEQLMDDPQLWNPEANEVVRVDVYRA
jgi:hypothetical protein